MKALGFDGFDLDVARARIALSLLAMTSLYIDPSTAGGLFHLTPYAFGTLICHFAYSATVLFALKRGFAVKRISSLSIALDLLFAGAIAFLTEGPTSSSYIFFVFAIIAVGMRAGLRITMSITLSGIALYLLAIGASSGLSGIFVMRAVYLAIVGYLVGFFGQQRAEHEERIWELEAQAARHAIARSLHDSFVQSLAGVNLRLEGCRELIRRGRQDDASKSLRDLQRSVNSEYDRVRSYIRSLAGVDSAMSHGNPFAPANPNVKIDVAGAVNSQTAERVFQILLEALRNCRKHSQANSVSIAAEVRSDVVHIRISDDGIGFAASDPPWSIASYVSESNGELRIDTSDATTLEIALPAA
jgi:signal transduction histidine kinase